MKTRVATNTPAVLIDREGREIRCTILDLSIDGFRVRLNEPTSINALAKLESGGKLYDIEVRWALGLELGGLLL